MIVRTLLIAALVLGVSSCGPQSASPPSTSAAPSSGDQPAPPAKLLDLMNKSSNKVAPYDKLPPPPIQGACFETGEAQSACYYRQYEVLRQWPLAWSGDYQAQRNISFMLSTNEPGVQGDKTQGCVWRIIITLSGHAKYEGALDEPNYDLYCGELSATNWASAKAMAKTTFKAITGESLPPVPEPTRRP
jgi:hypothetical protein